MDILNKLGANVKNHMSLVDEQFVNQVRKQYTAAPRTVTVRPTTVPLPPRPAETPAPAKAQAAAAPPAAPPQVKPPVKAMPPPAPAAQPQQSAPPPREARWPAAPRPALSPAAPPARQPAGRGRGKTAGPARPAEPARAGAPARRPGQRGPNQARTQPAAEEQRGGRPGGKRGGAQRLDARPPVRGRGRHLPARTAAPVKRSLELPAVMSVKDLANAMAQPVGDVIKKLMSLGVLATINQEIDYETAAIVAQDQGHEVKPAQSLEDKLKLTETVDTPESLVPRPPVVTVMGHVDHGKTSLLDAIRETNVTAQEAGGITQHIGAYQVEIKGRRITFLDTPGHQAFTAMRARGAQVTDMAILVVAADDGVMPQTVEAINHAKAANIPIIVAINKIDKPQANVERVKQELTEYALVAEEWGGETIMVEVSALKRTGLDHLLEMILLVADLRDLRANPDRPARGTIIEAQLDKGRGPVATVLVQNGTLELGDTIIAGAVAGRVRALTNDKGKRVRKAGPATPVEVIGLDGLPMAGDELHAIKDEHLARQVADQRQQIRRESELRRVSPLTLDDLFNRVKEGELKELKVIVKADVHGSAEALRQSLERITKEQVKVSVIHSGVGAIKETDIMLASASNAIIIGFNVRPDAAAKRLGEKENVDVRLYRVIYNAIEDIEAAMDGMLSPEYHEVVLGKAEVRAVFKVPKIGNVAGCFVTDGRIPRSADVRVLRDHVVVHEGKIGSLKRFKDDAREVAEGFECGIGLERFNDIQEGDVIEAFATEEIKREAKHQ
ncbi:MAG: translation initiation factor IF-2 [Patescibacteria group bacterium]